MSPPFQADIDSLKNKMRFWVEELLVIKEDEDRRPKNSSDWVSLCLACVIKRLMY